MEISISDTANSDTGLAALLLAIDPIGLGGAILRTRPGPGRDDWIRRLTVALPPETALRRLPAGTSEERLVGGIDIAATLAAGRPVASRGLLAECDGGVLVAAMAERMPPATASILASALDRRYVLLERDGLTARIPARLTVVALDEGDGPDESASPALRDRLAFILDPEADDMESPAVDLAARAAAARARIDGVSIGDDVIEALCATAVTLGITSVRAPILALAAARAHAALAGRTCVERGDVAVAARLVLAPRATRIPSEPAETPERQDDGAESDREGPGAPDGPPDAADAEAPSSAELSEMAVAATRAVLPPHLLDRSTELGPRRLPPSTGRSGAAARSRTRGRPVGARAGDLHAGARLDVLATVRAAIPWQALRRDGALAERAPGLASKSAALPRLEVRRDDFRIKRFKHRSETTTIFAVDASGSAALARLSEAKGAVELLLADCYVRRDQVAVLAFGGRGVQLLLPPTRSLVRAKRSLAALAGGGGTPLAGGLSAAFALASGLARRGVTPMIVLLTDGRANIAMSGKTGRKAAQDDTLVVARAMRATRLNSLLIDTSIDPSDFSRVLAGEMGARYMPLPNADGRTVSAAVREAISP